MSKQMFLVLCRCFNQLSCCHLLANLSLSRIVSDFNVGRRAGGLLPSNRYTIRAVSRHPLSQMILSIGTASLAASS